jgi:hypothetical protein
VPAELSRPSETSVPSMKVDTAPANASRDRACVGVGARPATCRLLTNSSRARSRKLLSCESGWDPRGMSRTSPPGLDVPGMMTDRPKAVADAMQTTQSLVRRILPVRVADLRELIRELDELDNLLAVPPWRARAAAGDHRQP